jgi:putative peptidoglycan binding protein
MAWRVARSLDQLLAQLNGIAPHRSKLSDGSIGDAAHATRASDHNPWYGPGIVTARDYTHDPQGGLDCHRLATALVTAKDPRIKYVIWNRRIIDSRAGQRPWQWVAYNGSNPHIKHLHLSVMANASCDDIRPWALPGLAPGDASTEPTPTGGALQQGSTGPAVTALQTRLNRDYPAYSKLAVDGVFGARTDAVVREFQRRAGLVVDGIAGPKTLTALHLT